MPRLLAKVLAAALLAGAPGGRVARSDEPPAEEAAPKDDAEAALRVGAWIADLRSERFEVRERARKAILRWGDRAPEVLARHRDDPDLEVRQTVRSVLDRLGPAPAPQAPAGDLSEIGRVTLSLRGAPRDLFDALGRAHGARIALPEGVPPEAALEASGTPFFAALESLAAACGLDASAPFDAAGTIVLSPRFQETAGSAWAAAGPLRARPVKVSATRSLTRPGERTYALTLALHWMPGVEVASYGLPQVLLAEDASGRAYRAPENARNVTYGVGQGNPAAEVTITLVPSSADAEERLASLGLAFDLRLRHGRRSIRFADLAALPVTYDQTGRPADPASEGTVTVRSVQKPGGPRTPLVVEISARLPGETPSQSARAFVEAPGGARTPLLVTARSKSADGLLRLTGRAYGGGADAEPAAVEVSWFTAEEAGEIRLNLTDVPLR